jgi:hypothetical protein
MCCCGFRSTQILIVSGKSRRAETETIEVHLRGYAATVDTILRWCLRARCEETPCCLIKTHGLPSVARPKGERRMVSRDGIEPSTRRLRSDVALFLPFPSNKEQQAAANGDTKRR